MFGQNTDMPLTSACESFMVALLWTWARVNISCNLFALCNSFDLSLTLASLAREPPAPAAAKLECLPRLLFVLKGSCSFSAPRLRLHLLALISLCANGAAVLLPFHVFISEKFLGCSRFSVLRARVLTGQGLECVEKAASWMLEGWSSTFRVLKWFILPFKAVIFLPKLVAWQRLRWFQYNGDVDVLFWENRG